MIKALLAVLVSLPLVACVADDDSEYAVDTSALSESAQAEFDATRQATAKYHSLDAALADGYSNTGLPCIDGQGYHYINGSLLGTFDPEQPHILVYWPSGDGNLRLVALEWLQPISGDTEVPTLFGHTFHGPKSIPGVPFEFYALHVWAWLNNSDGMFEDGNSKLVCP